MAIIHHNKRYIRNVYDKYIRSTLFFFQILAVSRVASSTVILGYTCVSRSNNFSELATRRASKLLRRWCKEGVGWKEVPARSAVSKAGADRVDGDVAEPMTKKYRYHVENERSEQTNVYALFIVTINIHSNI